MSRNARFWERARAAMHRRAERAERRGQAGGRRPAVPAPPWSGLEALEQRVLLSAGDLDPTFGVGGLVTTDMGVSATDYGQDVVAVQADGKIVVVGSSDQGTTRDDFALARYNTDGSLDTTFDADGKVTTDFAGSRDGAYSVAIDADGKIVVAGYSYHESTGADFALARYNPNGSLDGTFAGDGKVTTDFGGPFDFAHSVALDADGKIVVAGSSWQGAAAREDFALARYNTNGSLDGAFDDDGKVTTDFAGLSDSAYSIAIDADGKIVVAGYSDQGATGYDFALARYNTNGNLDGTFDDDGKVTTDFAGFSDRARSVAIDADGKIVVTGYSYHESTIYDFALARYNTNGSLDGAFDDDGKVTTDFAGHSDLALGLAIDADGKIVVAGYSDQGATGSTDFALARYNTDGSLDGTFDDDGKVTTDFAGSQDFAYSVAIDADGKIVVAGHSWQGGPIGSDFALARYEGLPTGTIGRVIDEIAGLASDPSLDPAAVTALQNAIGELQGQDGGDSGSGALDMIDQGNHNAAFVKILKAMEDLTEAEQADASLDLDHLKRQLALLAKSLSVDVILLAETLADSQNDQDRIAAAYEDLLRGQAFLDANEFEEAVNSFLDALRAVNSIT